MNTIKLQNRGTLTLPKKIREVLGLADGSILQVSSDKNRIILEKITTVSSDDSELLGDIKQSLADIKKGDFIEFSSINEFKKKAKAYGEN